MLEKKKNKSIYDNITNNKTGEPPPPVLLLKTKQHNIKTKRGNQWGYTLRATRHKTATNRGRGKYRWAYKLTPYSTISLRAGIIMLTSSLARHTRNCNSLYMYNVLFKKLSGGIQPRQTPLAVPRQTDS